MDVTTIYQVALGDGFQPYQWQRDLMNKEWPQVLIAPTGAGKTVAVTLGWVAHRLRMPEKTPRRLVWCFPMRSLVDQTAESITEWFKRLATELGEVSELPSPENIHVLMGGVKSQDWLGQPEHPAIIIGTQDMLLSRALMRGYASSRVNWPIEFALLHNDTQWVFDEVQLMGAGRATSAQLEAFRKQEMARVSCEHRVHDFPTRSLWISATLEPTWLKTVDYVEPPPESIMRVDPREIPNGQLARLVKAKKILNRSEISPKSSNNNDLKFYVAELSKSILAAHRTGFMTLVIVNRVKRAQDIYQELLKLKCESPSPQIVLIHSRFRSADRKNNLNNVIGGKMNDIIVVSTQAVEAGVDISAAVMFTELAPWSSMVQRFGRVNRNAEHHDGADVFWIDLLDDANTESANQSLAFPYDVEELQNAREKLLSLIDVAPVNLQLPVAIEPPLRVIRMKDLYELFDTDPDLSGFDVDISAYVRDANDTDIRVFWRELGDQFQNYDGSLYRPNSDELCTIPISGAKDWLKKLSKKSGKNRKNLVFSRDPQWRNTKKQTSAVPPGWQVFRGDPWPGITLLVAREAGGYNETIGFTGNPNDIPSPESVLSENTDDIKAHSVVDEEVHDEDPRSTIGVPVLLTDHLNHVAEESRVLCSALDIDAEFSRFIIRAARWHDLGKAHEEFQKTMIRGIPKSDGEKYELLAKTVNTRLRHERTFFRHELASALAFLHHESWSRDADLIAYLIVAHHGKLRMNIRPLPHEKGPPKKAGASHRFARGVWEGEELPSVDMGKGEFWAGGPLNLAIMEIGWDETTNESWTERTRNLLSRFGPFQLAWMETIVRVADWRASAKEREGRYDDI